MPENVEPATGLRRLADLGRAAGGQFVDGTMQLPASVGTGFIRVLAPEPGLRLSVHHCTLTREVTLRRVADDDTLPDTLLMGFYAFDPVPNAPLHLSSVQITSNDVSFTTTLPAHTAMFIVGIAIDKKLLASWLNGTAGALPAGLTPRHRIVLDTLMTPEIQQVLLQLTAPRPAHYLDSFFYKAKTQELLYFLFRELAHRADAPPRRLHPADVDKIFRVRAALLATLSAPPSLPALALAAGLSETKMKQLFRQVFGASLYNYYQAARMEEARRQLAYRSVSEVGYQLGFTNLSHFARLFEKHHGLRPKKYQATQLR